MKKDIKVLLASTAAFVSFNSDICSNQTSYERNQSLTRTTYSQEESQRRSLRQSRQSSRASNQNCKRSSHLKTNEVKIGEDECWLIGLYNKQESNKSVMACCAALYKLLWDYNLFLTPTLDLNIIRQRVNVPIVNMAIRIRGSDSISHQEVNSIAEYLESVFKQAEALPRAETQAIYNLTDDAARFMVHDIQLGLATLINIALWKNNNSIHNESIARIRKILENRGTVPSYKSSLPSYTVI